MPCPSQDRASRTIRCWRCYASAPYWCLSAPRPRAGRRCPDRAPRPLRRVPQLAEVAAPRAVFAAILRRRPPARTARCGSLTGMDPGTAGAKRRPCAEVDQRHASSPGSPATGVQQLPALGIHRQTSVPIDRRSTREQLCGCRPSLSGEYRSNCFRHGSATYSQRLPGNAPCLAVLLVARFLSMVTEPRCRQDQNPARYCSE